MSLRKNSSHTNVAFSRAVDSRKDLIKTYPIFNNPKFQTVKQKNRTHL